MSDQDDCVVLARDPRASSVTLSWVLTEDGNDAVTSGELRVLTADPIEAVTCSVQTDVPEGGLTRARHNRRSPLSRTGVGKRPDRLRNDIAFWPSLVAITDNVNSVKGARDPAEWLPPRAAARCTYAIQWVQVKYRWRLTINTAERDRLASLISGSCGARKVVLPPRGSIRAMAAVRPRAGCWPENRPAHAAILRAVFPASQPSWTLEVSTVLDSRASQSRRPVWVNGPDWLT